MIETWSILDIKLFKVTSEGYEEVDITIGKDGTVVNGKIYIKDGEIKNDLIGFHEHWNKDSFVLIQKDLLKKITNNKNEPGGTTNPEE